MPRKRRRWSIQCTYTQWPNVRCTKRAMYVYVGWPGGVPKHYWCASHDNLESEYLKGLWEKITKNA